MSGLLSPFPYFGGKRSIAVDVWMRLGNPTQYIEPFCGSAAVLLAAPRPASLEVIGDGSGFIANFWRATKHQSAVVAEWADYPVSHIDLGARHVWLMAQRTRIGDAMQDPDWPGDAKVAGWWLWGQCCWIGSGWCDWFGKIPHASDAGMGVQAIGHDHLFWDWARLVFEIRPLWCAAENSPRARTAGIDGILDALEQANYAFWPLVVGADNAGANHRRKRLWLFAADAERIELWEQSWRRCWANRRGAAVFRDDAEHAARERWREGWSGAVAEGCSENAGASRDAADTDSPRYPLRPRLGSDDGAELPAALRDIGRAWPDWNGGIAGLSAACAAAGFGALDDGTDTILAPGLRNRCIAALGDAVVPQIPEAIGNAIMKTSNGSKTLTMT